MNDINKRLFQIFSACKLKQNEFASRIGVSQAYISKLFKDDSDKTPSERIIKLVCSEFNISEEWLRSGAGEMFIQNRVVSLDDYARKNNISDFEADIIKLYMGLDESVRKEFMQGLKEVVLNSISEKNLSVVKKSRLVAAHNDAEMTDEEKENMQKDIEDLKNL